jgi:N-acyl-D-aspartate/D-glutamate deacylase
MLRSPIVLFLAAAAFAQAPAPTSGHRVHRLLIHNATVIDGNGTPASGPKDILIEDNVISAVIPLDPVALSRSAPPGMRGQANAAPPDAVIDATGKYVLPGLINAHAHLQEERVWHPRCRPGGRRSAFPFFL